MLIYLFTPVLYFGRPEVLTIGFHYFGPRDSLVVASCPAESVPFFTIFGQKSLVYTGLAQGPSQKRVLTVWISLFNLFVLYIVRDYQGCGVQNWCNKTVLEI